MTLKALHKLIQSLTNNEFVFFKSHYTLKEATKKKDRIAVFDYLKKQQDFDETAFKKKFKSKDLSKICNGLIDAILDYLLLYHKAQNAKQAIHLGLVKANILEEIGLNDIATKLLENIEKICIQIEDHYSRIIVITELTRLYGYKQYIAKINEKQKELNKNILILGKESSNYFELKKIEDKFIKRKIIFKENEQNNLLSDSEIELLKDENIFTNGRFKQVQLFNKSRYFASIGNFRESLSCLEKLIAFYEKDFLHNEFNSLGFISSLNNIILKLISTKNYKKAAVYLDKFSLIAEKVNQNPLRKAHYYYRFFNCSFQYHFVTNNHNFIIKHEKKCIEIIEELSTELPIYNTFTLWYFLGIANFYNKKYSKAQVYFKLLLDHKKIKDRKQIESIAKLLNFVCSIESNKTYNDFVNSVKRNSNLYFKKNPSKYKTDELLLEMLNKICNNGNYAKKQKSEILKSYLPSFKKLQKQETERLKDLGIMQYLL